MSIREVPVPSQEQTMPAENGYADLARGYQKIFTQTLEELGLRDVTVSEQIEYRDRAEFTKTMNLGLMGEIGTSLAILAAAEGAIPQNQRDIPVTTVLTIPTDNGESLLMDPSTHTLWSEFFYVSENHVLKPIVTTQPIPIDGLVPLIHYQEEMDELSEFFPGKEALRDITEDKWKTREVLQKAGLAIPDGILISEEADLAEQIRRFTREYGSDGVVIKSTSGSQGNFVRMFEPGDEEAIEYAQSHLHNGLEVLVERRIIPHPLLLPKSVLDNPQVKIDHNLRVLVTKGDYATILDAEIRYDSYSGSPVNISQGAKALDSFRLLGSMPVKMIDDMYEASLTASEALYDAAGGNVRESSGYIGLDVIIDKDGIPYIIEANSGLVGGITTLTKLHKKPLRSIEEKLIPSTENALLRRFDQRVSAPVNTIPYPFNTFSYQTLADAYAFAEKEERVLELAEQGAILLTPTHEQFIRGKVCKKKGDFKNAIREYAQGFIHDIKDYDYMYEITDCLVKSERKDLAIGFLDYFYQNSGHIGNSVANSRTFLTTGHLGDIPPDWLDDELRLYDLVEEQGEVVETDFDEGIDYGKKDEAFIRDFVEFLGWEGDVRRFFEIGAMVKYLPKDNSLFEEFAQKIVDQEKVLLQEDRTAIIALWLAEIPALMESHEAATEAQHTRVAMNFLFASQDQVSLVVYEQLLANYPQADENEQRQLLKFAELYSSLCLKQIVAEGTSYQAPDDENPVEFRIEINTLRKYRDILYPLVISEWGWDQNLVEHAESIASLFDNFSSVEDLEMLDRYIAGLEEQLGVTFRIVQSSEDLVTAFHAADQEAIQRAIEQQCKKVKSPQQRRKIAEDLVRYGELSQENVTSRHNDFVLEFIDKEFSLQLRPHLKRLRSQFGREKLDYVLNNWLRRKYDLELSDLSEHEISDLLQDYQERTKQLLQQY